MSTGRHNDASQSTPAAAGVSYQYESQIGEPIAVIGMACKFPGASDVGALWRLLETGGNAITEGDPGSGIGRIGEFYPKSAAQYPACRYAALVDDIDLFDAEFFRISPVEAQLLDPQQRMTLETCWQALENAGIDPEGLRNTNAGVFIGVSNNDYRGLSLGAAGQTTEPAASLYTLSGTSFNTLAGRVCYALGLEGPALVLDTACSSSLVAVHLAVSALHRREADLILAGGAQAIFSGLPSKLRAQARMLSPDGQCKAFDASANGFVRGEGCGVVALKRLSDAEADGDPIWGVVLGSAINQDGASAGLTVPSAPAQIKVIEEALLQAGVEPADVDYLEAHGTGTEVGDPIELNSAAEVYGRGRSPDRPLLVGSIKTNVGHLEPTAGIAGLMKALLSMRHGVIPKHLHFKDPNPRVDWANLPVQITDRNSEWPPTNGRPPRAGVSSYGWSGTNAHVIVEGYGELGVTGTESGNGEVAWPSGSALSVGAAVSLDDANRSDTAQEMEERPTRLLPLSGKSEDALRDSARSFLGWLDEREDESALADLAWSASMARSHFDFRESVVFRDINALRAELADLADATRPTMHQNASRVAFVYTGQGNQWTGMGEALYRQEPVFREVLDRCDGYIREERGVSLLDVMFGHPSAKGDLDEPRWTQPAIYALECGLTALWRSLGVEPVAVLGHSLGEIAAAQASGVFSLEDGMKFASARGRLMGDLPRAGAMAAVFAPADRVAAEVSEWNEVHGSEDLCIGVDNGTHQVISGPAEEVQAFTEKLESEGINLRRLRSSPAYHSPLVEPALNELQAVFNDFSVRRPSVPIVSNVTGEPVGPDAIMDGAYWRQHARQTVQFRGCVETLATELQVDAVIELGPHAILGPLVSLNWPQSPGVAATPLILQSLMRPSFDGSEPERADAFISAVAGAYKAGLPVALRGLFAGEKRRKINIPGYPFQRRRFWVQASQRQVSEDSHPLLGTKHESPRGEAMFEIEMFPSEPTWLNDHRVYGRVIMPGALYGSMAATVPLTEGSTGAKVEELQLHSPLVYPDYDPEDAAAEPGRRVQLVLEGGKGNQQRNFEIFSKGESDEEWTLHAAGRLAQQSRPALTAERIDPEALKSGMQPQDLAAYYRTKAATGIEFGPSFRTLEALWGAGAEALGEVALQIPSDGQDATIHPSLLDGCFQVLSATRTLAGIGGDATYLPFAWERLWLNGPAPPRLLCHARLRETSPDGNSIETQGGPPETLTGDLWFYSPDGTAVGGLTGFALKRATRASLLSATEDIQDLLYEMIWRERPLPERLQAADALAAPSAIAVETAAFAEYLAAEGVATDDRAALLHALERLSRAYALAALNKMGWQQGRGAIINPEELREQMGVLAEHSRLLERMLRLLADGGLLEHTGDGHYRVMVGASDPLPDEAFSDPEAFADQVEGWHPHGSNELGLLRRSGGALAEVLQGEVDPLSILFPREGAGAADFYFTAPASRASNRLLGDAVASAVADWPADRRLRILEVGAGTGSGTSVVLPELPEGNFDYVFTDISAGFFAEAENRFRDSGAPLEYRALDIEREPEGQGYDLHAYDLVIAVNVLHATRNLGETLGHCRDLLAPCGQLLAVESLRGRGWQDMTFGQLDGWWRYSDQYRPNHAVASPEVWRKALTDVGFEDPTVLGGESRGDDGPLGSGVIMAQGPAEVAWAPGTWVLSADDGGHAESLARELATLNQTVVLAGKDLPADENPDVTGVTRSTIETEDRASWMQLLEDLPDDLPLRGVVHCAALQGHGTGATTEELAEDARRSGAGALALVQGLLDADLTLVNGLWFLTRGAQALERDYLREAAGELAGATLWGFGKALAREVGHLQTRMIDLDPAVAITTVDVANELLFPDAETHIAHRSGSRLAGRLVRAGQGKPWLPLAQDREWRIVPNPGDGLSGLRAEPATPRPLESGEVRVAVEAAGLNFSDILISVGAVEMDPMLGDEFCGRITEVAADVTDFAVGDRALGLGIGALRPDLAVCAELVAHAPAEVPAEALATIPTAFVSAELSFQMSGLRAGDRVLIHTASGGVGLAAIQLVQAAGAEVFATASAPKQTYLRSLGIRYVYDSRSTDFCRQILEDTQGAGVTVVLNSLTGPGFIEANLECLAANGRFVEMSRRDIWTADEMAAERPDVAYSVLEVDALKRQDPATAGASLRRVMARVTAGELGPLVHTRWPIAEISAAMEFMRSTRHIGKNVIAMPPLAQGGLRADRTYLVTGGLGGIGIVVAGWLAERGAGVIVLNGRRPPGQEAEEAIDTLRQQGADVRVELADMTDSVAVDAMMERIGANLPPLAGVIHSVGVLSDGALGNQTWERFEQVLWPKMLGAWHLHQATLNLDLDMFVLFSSAVGVMGNSGQGNHAAANAFLDQLAGYRRSLGLPGQAIAWGAWSELGEAAEQRERIESQLTASGSDWISPQQGLKAFDELMRHDRTFTAVTAVDWPVRAASFEQRPTFLEELLLEEEASSVESDAAGSADLLTQLRQQPGDWDGLIVPFLQRELQAVLRMPAAPAPNVGFFDLGMDSLMSVELRNRLNRALAGEYVVSNTAVFDYPNIGALANHLRDELGQALGSASPEPMAKPVILEPERTIGTDDDAIAIVGMACRFPQAKNLAEYWQLLESGTDAVTDGRRVGGPWDGAVGDPTAEDLPSRRGAFVDDIEWFDSRFFRIAPIEARLMDPRQRMMLETSWEALEDAGIDPDGLRGSHTGVYAGVGGSEYRDLIEANGRADSYLGTTASVTAGRVAFALGLEGPAMPIDMACASSLAAVHQAAAALRKGEVNLALAGGVHVVLSRSVSSFMMEVGMLSPTGQCRPFDASANGYVRGEGCGIVVLKRLSDAKADGDRIWGVIRGTAINQNGASAALTVPNGLAQERVMEAALNQAGLVGTDVDYLEAQAVGSKLADAIELRAIGAVYGKGRDADRPLLTGTAKANIGHLEAAAGMAGLIKTVLAMKQEVIPRQVNFEESNPEIDWEQLAVRVPSESIGWPTHPARPPRAAVSAFGISGTNAHLVVEGYGNDSEDNVTIAGMEFFAGAAQSVPTFPAGALADAPQTESAPAARSARFLPLSGKSEGALRDLAKQYLSWIDQRTDHSSDDSSEGQLLADMAWTASVGRSHFGHRAGVVFKDTDTLRQGLAALSGTEVNTGKPEPHPATRVVFRYSGEGSQWAGMGATLYESEPVARFVLDRCEAATMEQRGTSLLDVIFGRVETNGGLGNPLWARSAIYALECALTALWSSLGIRPNSALGEGCGVLAAAQALGAFSLEDGLRLAMDSGALPEAHANLDGLVKTIADSEADRVIDIGPSMVETDTSLTNAVAKAYEAGLTVSLKGLFAGESRRRISLPSYPFQRRRHWI